jgi:hypothetical protein
MMSYDLNRKTEPLPVARATLLVAAPQQTEDKVAHFGSCRECKRGLVSKRPVMQDNGFIMVGEDRYSSAEVIEFRNGSDELLNFV